MANESSPLLNNNTPVYQSGDSSDELPTLAVISSEGTCTAQADEQLLKKRLNGASIYAVFSG